MVFHRDLIRHADIWIFVLKRLRTRDGLISLAPPLWILFFVWATFFIDTILVTVLAATSPMLFVMFRQWHDQGRSTRRYKSVMLKDWGMLLIALASISLVTLSQAGGLLIEGSWWRIPAGLLLSACSAMCVSWMAYRFKLGEDLYGSRCRGGQREGIGDKAELACLLVVMVVTSVVGLAIGLLGILAFGEGRAFSPEALSVVVLGLVSGSGGILFRHANLETTNLGVNAIAYLRPVLSMIWLGWFATVEVHRPDWLIIGTIGVIVANALINLRPSSSSGQP
jgi:hypothetical protein